MHRLAVCLIVALAAACGGADETGTFADSVAGSVAPIDLGADAMSDANIVATLVATDAAEIRASEFALDSASSGAVKEFARMMIEEHKAMSESIHQVARSLNIVSNPGDQTDDVADDSKDIAEELAGKSGAELDRAYLDAMVSSHEEALQTIDQAANATNTAQLDQALADAKTKVQTHLDRARQIREVLDRE